jgi:hypothetical protein
VRVDRVPCKRSFKEVRHFQSGGDAVSGLLGCGAVLLFRDVLYECISKL